MSCARDVERFHYGRRTVSGWAEACDNPCLGAGRFRGVEPASGRRGGGRAWRAAPGPAGNHPDSGRGGQVLQTGSDSVLAVFDVASAALNRALEIQRVLDGTPGEGVRLGGLCSGLGCTQARC